jgi:hypothetical protein
MTGVRSSDVAASAPGLAGRPAGRSAIILIATISANRFPK